CWPRSAVGASRLYAGLRDARHYARDCVLQEADSVMIFARDRRVRVKALLKKEFRQLMRDPKTKRFMFGAPIVQLLLFGYAVNTDVHDLATYVVDYDNTSVSREVQDALTAGGYFTI